MRRPLLPALLLVPALLLPACGSGSATQTGAGSGDGSSTGASVPAADTCSTVQTPVPANVPAVSGAPGAEPTIAQPTGAAPTELVVTDLVEGTGEVACAGATVTVHYTGVDWETGAVFDSSWQRGEPISFPLDGLIEGWQVGLPGMKVDGRRELVIPPEQAYGPAGSGSELAGKTLVFVVDLVAVGA